MATHFAATFKRITTSTRYMPEIDGIRFLSLLLIVLFHIRGYFLDRTPVRFTDSPASYKWFNLFLNNAHRSVPLFFCISGFILCLPFARYYLMQDIKPDLGRYYLRRFTRLEPPYFIAMTAIYLAHAATGGGFTRLLPSLLASLLYVHNIVFHHHSYLNTVAWSLEVEMQFYLIAPSLFRLLSLTALVRRTLLISLIVSSVAVQNVYVLNFRSIYDSLQFFLAGILLADLYVSEWAMLFMNKKWMVILAPVLFTALFYMHIGKCFPGALLFPILMGLFFLVILRNDIVRKVFSYQFIPLVGGMTYSIYLTHYVLISFLGRFTMHIKLTDFYLPNLFLQFVLLGVPVLLVASVVYLYIERPFMSVTFKKLSNNKSNQANQ